MEEGAHVLPCLYVSILLRPNLDKINGVHKLRANIDVGMLCVIFSRAAVYRGTLSIISFRMVLHKHTPEHVT